MVQATVKKTGFEHLRFYGPILSVIQRQGHIENLQVRAVRSKKDIFEMTGYELKRDDRNSGLVQLVSTTYFAVSDCKNVHTLTNKLTHEIIPPFSNEPVLNEGNAATIGQQITGGNIRPSHIVQVDIDATSKDFGISHLVHSAQIVIHIMGYDTSI